MELCDRCFEALGTDHVMSVFNQQVICLPCQYKEIAHPTYRRAARCVDKAISMGVRYYKGIGLPPELNVKPPILRELDAKINGDRNPPVIKTVEVISGIKKDFYSTCIR